MKRIDGGTISSDKLIQFITKTIDGKQLTHDMLYSINNGRANLNPRGIIRDYCINAFQPLASIVNDIQYTFKPYRAFTEALHDLNLLSRGCMNIAKGILHLIAVPFKILFSPLSAAVTQWAYRKRAETNNKIIRGAIQIAMIPLCWIQILFRAAITKYVGGYTSFTDNEQTVRLVAAYEKCAENDGEQTSLPLIQPDQKINSRLQIINALMYEYKKWNKAGQPCDIQGSNTEENIDQLYRDSVVIGPVWIPNTAALGGMSQIYLPQTLHLAQARKFVEFFKQREKIDTNDDVAASSDPESQRLLPQTA